MSNAGRIAQGFYVGFWVCGALFVALVGGLVVRRRCVFVGRSYSSMKRFATFRGRRVSLPNPSEPNRPAGTKVPADRGACASTRKPTKAVSDRAKRYRANQPGCKPSGPRRCIYCKSTRYLVVDHADGNESNGAKKNLVWACKSCNTRLGHAFKAAGVGVRTRQYNPAPDFKQYAWAVGMICRKRDLAAGRCSRSDDPLVKEAVAIIRATPARLRSEYAARAAAGRGRSSFSDVPF